METTGKVKLKRKPFDYMLYDGSNYEKIREFVCAASICKPNDDDADFMLGCGVGRMEWVSPGMYVVKDDQGFVYTYTREMFERKFEPWDFQDDMKTFILHSHRTCNEDECFVGQTTEDEMSHEIVTDYEKKKRLEVTKDDHVIRCVICHEPATTLDCHYPYEVEMNRCTKHQHSKIDPCAWEDYGTAVEVCKEHYSFLVLKDTINERLDWLNENDKSVTGKILFKILVNALKQLDGYMNITWPKEQMGTSKEDEANGK